MLKPKKEDLHQPVMLGEFMEFADFVTENVAMKKDITGVEHRLDRMEQKFDGKFDGMEGKLVNFRSDILTAVDKVLKEVKTTREEDAAHNINHRDIADDIVNLKKRTSRLEAGAGIS